MSAAPARRNQVELRKPEPETSGTARTPRPDCAIWNDIARALGAKPEHRK